MNDRRLRNFNKITEIKKNNKVPSKITKKKLLEIQKDNNKYISLHDFALDYKKNVLRKYYSRFWGYEKRSHKSVKGLYLLYYVNVIIITIISVIYSMYHTKFSSSVYINILKTYLLVFVPIYIVWYKSYRKNVGELSNIIKDRRDAIRNNHLKYIETSIKFICDKFSINEDSNREKLKNKLSQEIKDYERKTTLRKLPEWGRTVIVSIISTMSTVILTERLSISEFINQQDKSVQITMLLVIFTGAYIAISKVGDKIQGKFTMNPKYIYEKILETINTYEINYILLKDENNNRDI